MLPMYRIPSGCSFNHAVPSNAYESMLMELLWGKVISLSELQPLNALAPTYAKLSGRTMLLIPEQPLNDNVSILVMLAGMVMSVISLHPKNAPEVIEVTLYVLPSLVTVEELSGCRCSCCRA